MLTRGDQEVSGLSLFALFYGKSSETRKKKESQITRINYNKSCISLAHVPVHKSRWQGRKGNNATVYALVGPRMEKSSHQSCPGCVCDLSRLAHTLDCALLFQMKIKASQSRAHVFPVIVPCLSHTMCPSLSLSRYRLLLWARIDRQSPHCDGTLAQSCTSPSGAVTISLSVPLCVHDHNWLSKRETNNKIELELLLELGRHGEKETKKVTCPALKWHWKGQENVRWHRERERGRHNRIVNTTWSMKVSRGAQPWYFHWNSWA